MDPTRVVVDTNILFSSLLRRETRFRQVLLAQRGRTFYSPRFVVVEMFKHKERISAVTQLPDEELLECLNAYLSRITFVDEGVIPIGTWVEGRRLCVDVDLKGTPFVTLAIYLDGLLWTADAQLEAGLRAKGFAQFFSP